MEIKYDFLLIEDNHIDQFVMTQLFKKVFNVTEVSIANNGREGIDWIYENRRKISNPLVILLDIQMPIMNGLQFLSEYDKLEEELKKETQIYMLSSSLDIDEIQQLQDNKYVTDFLSKPISVDRFRERLNTCL